MIQQQYKSGILNVDCPLDKNTHLYSDVKEQILEKLKSNESKSMSHQNWLIRKQGTHHFIDINNSNSKDIKTSANRYDGQVYMQNKKKFKIDYQEYFKDSTNYDGIKKSKSIIEKRQKRMLNL